MGIVILQDLNISLLVYIYDGKGCVAYLSDTADREGSGDEFRRF